MADGIREVAALKSPLGIVQEKWETPSGLKIRRITVPIGVVGIIYEARPNVTSDTAALCLKSGNAVVLRGSADAMRSNKAIVSVLKNAINLAGGGEDIIQLITDASREGAAYMMTQNGLIDVLVPRGGAALIKATVENSTIPVIETGAGNCHIYVEKTAELDMAEQVLVNAKTQRISVCNTAESLLVDKAICQKALPRLLGALKKHGVTVYGCPLTRDAYSKAEPATEQDYYAEYLDYKISVKVVHGVKEAVEHINKYGTHHSDAIITQDKDAAVYFAGAVDSACVYVNTSTRFTDGGEFGFGAELGISTQKLHARGPVGLRELCSYKYIIESDGRVRG